MIEVTRDRIKIKDSLHGFNYECKISFRNCFYNAESIVFCEEVDFQNHKILLYKEGRLIELVQSTNAKILYADSNLDRIVFITKGDNTLEDLMDLYIYENNKTKLFCPKVNHREINFFVLENKMVMTYLVESSNKSDYDYSLWNLFETDLYNKNKLVERNVKKYSGFLNEKNEIKYIICKWSNRKVRYYTGLHDEDFDWLVVKAGRKSKEFALGHHGDYFISLQGKLVLLKMIEKIHTGNPGDIFSFKTQSTYTLSLVSTDTLEEVFIEKTEDSRKFHFTNWLYFAGEFIDLNHSDRHGINIGADLIEKYPHYFKHGKKQETEYAFNVFFSRTNKKTYYIAMELATKADSFIAINNPYPLDDSQNYIVSFNKENDYNILVALLGSVMYEGSEIKFRVFGIDIFELMRCCSGEFSWGINNDVKYYKYMMNAISELKKYYQTDSSIRVREYLQTDIIEKYSLEKPVVPPNKSPYKGIYKEIEQNLLIQHKLPAKWKSEQDLYRVISSVFTDAIFQYREEWIKPQSIDIYVPQLKCAFEYQGQQHFSSIELFGGEESFKKRVLLDERKRKLCAENGVTLIEWRFDEPITKLELKKKLKHYDIELEE